MYQRFLQEIERWQSKGWLLIASNLLLEALIVGWLVFFGFYSVEVLLPTFITARFSLVKVFIVLMFGTLLWVALDRRNPEAAQESFILPRSITVLIGLWGLIIIALSLYRFPWWNILMQLILFGSLVWLLWRQGKENGDLS